MKKTIKKLILFTLLSISIFSIIYSMYINPIYKMNSVDTWYKYLTAIFILTVVYALMIYIGVLIGKLIDWCIDYKK